MLAEVPARQSPDDETEPPTALLLSPYLPSLKQYTEQGMPGPMADVICLLNQMPEAPEHVESDLDEVSRASMRLRRGSAHLEFKPSFVSKIPTKMWTPEDRPPASEEQDLMKRVHEYMMSVAQSLEDAYDAMVVVKDCLTTHVLRNTLGLIGTTGKKDYYSKRGHWPKGLMGTPESVFSALRFLVRPRADCITKEDFLKLKRNLDAEDDIVRFLKAQGASVFDAPEAGHRLRSIISISDRIPKNGKTAIELLNCVEMLVDMEPKASATILLFDSECSTLSCLIDMVLSQGLPGIENRSLLRLWDLCQKVLKIAIANGRPKGSTSIDDERISPVAAQDSLSVAARSDERKSQEKPQEKPLLGKSKTLEPTRPETPLEAKSSNPGRFKAAVHRVVKRSRTMKLPGRCESLQECSSSSAAEKGDSALSVDPSEKSEAIIPKPTPKAQTRKGRPSLNRRATIGDMSTICANATAVVDNFEGRWDIECCAMLWACMPAQSIGFSIGMALHSLKSHTLMQRYLRAGWAFLDTGNALYCAIEYMGVGRLRMQMDVLADQFIRSFHLVSTIDTEELNVFVEAAKLTMARVELLCEGDVRMAQLAVLYGVSFLAEGMATWADRMAGIIDCTALSKAARNLVTVLKPSLASFYKRSIASQEKAADALFAKLADAAQGS